MKPTITKFAWLLAAAASLSFTAAFPATLYDNFKTKWRTIQRGSGTALSMVRNRLEISLGPNARSDGNFFGHGLAGTCRLSGDFDLRVSFRLLDWPARNGVRVSLYLGSLADIKNEGIYLERDNYDDEVGNPLEVYVYYADEGLTYVEHPTADMSGRFRLRRDGSIVTGYIWSDHEWIELGSSDAGRQNLPFALFVYSHDSEFADSNVRIAFESVRLEAGSLTGAACPFPQT